MTAINVPKVIITHHTGGTDAFPLADSSKAKVADIDIWHRARWPGFRSTLGYWVGYQYVIEKNGKVTQTRSNSEEGAHTLGMNRSSIGVCFSGNFDLTMPTRAQMKSWYTLHRKLQKAYPGITTYPHRKYSTKTCHGRNLPDDYFTDEFQIRSLTELLNQLKAKLASLLSGNRMK